MANYYFELSDWIVERATIFGFKGKYFCMSNKLDADTHVSQELARNSERIWKESDQGVTFVKHRGSMFAPVDMKEFMWIKLQSKTID